MINGRLTDLHGIEEDGVALEHEDLGFALPLDLVVLELVLDFRHVSESKTRTKEREEPASAAETGGVGSDGEDGEGTERSGGGWRRQEVREQSDRRRRRRRRCGVASKRLCGV